MFLRTLGRTVLALAVACVPLGLANPAPVLAAKPIPGFVELQGNTWQDVDGQNLQAVAFLPNSPNIKGMQVRHVIDFDIPLQASTVTLTATLQRISSKTGLVDQTFATLAGTGAIDRDQGDAACPPLLRSRGWAT